MLYYSEVNLTISNVMNTKIQQLLSNWPTGAVRTVSALKRADYSQDLLNRYRYSGWLKSVGDGALAKSGDTPTLFGALFALQHDLKLNVHIGARSALELQGMGHYVRSGKRTTSLFGDKKRLPKWFMNYNWESDIRYSSSGILAAGTQEGLVEYREREICVLISGDIRAMIEILSFAPLEYGLDEAKDLMLGLTSVHPLAAQKLLRQCKSIKAKRLFLLLAEECGHDWALKIDLKGIDLGTGPRNLTPGGRLHKKYLVTVPASVLAEDSK